MPQKSSEIQAGAHHVPHAPDEQVAVVDESDCVIGKDTRSNVHSKCLLHREVFCYLINSKKQLLLQKRSDTHRWDHSVGGHFPYSQTYEEGIRREFEEELGYRLPPTSFKELGKEKITHTSHGGTNIRFAKVFLVTEDIPISALKPDPGEVEEVRYFSRAELEELFCHADQITSNLRYLIEKYLGTLLA